MDILILGPTNLILSGHCVRLNVHYNLVLTLSFTYYVYHSVTEKFLENIHMMLNEPSVGLYRVQEHVRRSLPQLVDKKVSMSVTQK